MSSPSRGLAELRKMIERRRPRLHAFEAFQLGALISQMEKRAPGEAPHRRFRELCDLVAAAFPDDHYSDGYILGSAVTPVLIRYIVRALREYRDGSDGLDANGRAAAMADALRLVRRMRDGASAPKWTEERQMEYYLAFWQAREAAVNSGKPPKEAFEIGTDAAYKAYRGDTDKQQDEKERRLVRRQLLALFKEHGHQPERRTPTKRTRRQD